MGARKKSSWQRHLIAKAERDFPGIDTLKFEKYLEQAYDIGVKQMQRTVKRVTTNIRERERAAWKSLIP